MKITALFLGFALRVQYDTEALLGPHYLGSSREPDENFSEAIPGLFLPRDTLAPSGMVPLARCKPPIEKNGCVS